MCGEEQLPCQFTLHGSAIDSSVLQSTRMVQLEATLRVNLEFGDEVVEDAVDELADDVW